MGRRSLRHHILNFQIDDYINPWLPGPLYSRLPRPISHFLGHRTSKPDTSLPATIETLHAAVSIFIGLIIVSAIGRFSPDPVIRRFAPQSLIPSLGAGAILNFVSISTPAAQPRPTVLGHLVSAAVGVGVSRLFQLSPASDDLTWVAAPLAVALAGLAMRVTNTVHPPGGATAALAVGSGPVRDLGWDLLPLITVGTTTMVATACLLNNVGRRWPVYWWTSVDLPVGRGGGGEADRDGPDVEKDGGGRTSHDDGATVVGDGGENGGGKSGSIKDNAGGGPNGSPTYCTHCGRH